MADRLPSQRERTARQNLDALLHEARNDCAAFGRELAWDSAVWEVTPWARERRGKAGRNSRLWFVTHDNPNARRIEQRTPLSEPFASMVKAIVRLRFDASMTSVDPLARFIVASRYLHDELADRGHDPALVVSADFDRAAAAILRGPPRMAGKAEETREDSQTPYRLGQALQTLAEWIDRRGLSKVTLNWRSPIAKVRHGRSSSVDGSDRQSEKMPTDDLLDAVSRLAGLVEEPQDELRMACVKLLHCAPWRIGEVLTLHEDCEVERERVSFDPGDAAAEPPVMRYGIRYWKEKSSESDIKWIPTAMVDVARGAIADIRRITAGARELARWMEAEPGRAMLPGADLGADQIFGAQDVSDMFGLSGRKAGAQWLRGRGFSTGPAGIFAVTRAALEETLLTEMAERMPDPAERPWSSYLFLVHRNFFHAQRGTNPCSLELTVDQSVSDFLCGREDGKNAVRSAFERYDVRTADGEVARITSHMFRHWLNTVAQLGGLDQAVIARFSGRDDARQNEAYDHVSGIRLAEMTREMMADDRMMGHLADMHRALPPAERGTFRETMLATAHVTDIGLCLNDWTTSPCPEFGSCATCVECAVTKGDEQGLARARHLRDDTAWMVERTIAEIDDGTLDASNHLRGQQEMLAGLDRIIAIHEDADIPDGTLVQPSSASRPHYGGGPIGAVA